VSAAGQTFGRRLRDHRELQRITLDTIAATTKIKLSVLAELERGDVSTWPSGIFRRAFVREYAAAVGLPADSLVAEFVHLFPDPDETISPAAPAPATDLRLTLAVDRRQLMAAAFVRAAAALVEAGSIAAVAGLMARIAATSFWPICGAIALVYYALAAACMGRSPASWYLQSDFHAFLQRRPVHSASPDSRELIHLVQRPRELPQEPVRADPATEESAPPRRAASR